MLELLLAIGVAGLATLASRMLPFLALRRFQGHPLLRFLGEQLPAAIMTILVLFALRRLRPLGPELTLNMTAEGVPLLLAALVVAGLHLWRGNVLLSIAAGTALYMALVQNLPA
ncbi:branched-chain amino acid transporter permease [Alcanivorax quisquiliarum]|uniref:AzlD domain-containing protein n=1 Tax=Alcanivorax quisquiliarum TaxID=2933565 RepID=A0ABT0E6M1_9GAMM|nr:AzlD domain-containing protein [Alcanivorax quisquiliarum]MCK0537474.1 AzlD domain-containing protein [Alcanivorax quisquiliarum]